MNATKGIIFGAIFGFFLSFGSSFLFMFCAQVLAGGVMSLSGEMWLYYATVIPFTLTFAIFGYYFSKKAILQIKNFGYIAQLVRF